MTQEEKRLLIKDLSARVFYGVKVNIERDFPNNPQIVERISKDGEIIVNGILAYDIYYYKPYLRPMSSMTDKERKDWYRQSKVYYDCEFKPEPTLSLENCHLSVDWLNKRGFDYRGLIPMGLALEAPKDMYKEE